MKKLLIAVSILTFCISCGSSHDLAEGDMVRLEFGVTGMKGMRMLNFWYQSSTADGTQVDSVTVDGLYIPAEWAPTTEIQIMEGQLMLEVNPDEEGASEKQPHPVYGVLLDKKELLVQLYIQGELFGERKVEVNNRDELVN